MLSAREVTVVLGHKPILRRASVTLFPGEVVAVIGPNGAGKSTLLRTLAGGLAPSAGEILLDGRAITAWTRRDLARRRAVVPQDATLSFPLSAIEVVLLGRSPHLGASTAHRDIEIATAALRATGTDRLADRDYTTLSGGERQRVQFARALAQVWAEDGDRRNARYLLLDEPTASLDLKHQRQVLELARRCADQGFGVLVVLHDFNLAAAYADRLWLLVDGQLAAEGAPADVLSPARVEWAFSVAVTVRPHPRTGRPLVIPD